MADASCTCDYRRGVSAGRCVECGKPSEPWKPSRPAEPESDGASQPNSVSQVSCPRCDGNGWTAEHHHECFGDCRAGLCPVQEQCAWCRGEGTVSGHDLSRSTGADPKRRVGPAS